MVALADLESVEKDPETADWLRRINIGWGGGSERSKHLKSGRQRRTTTQDWSDAHVRSWRGAPRWYVLQGFFSSVFSSAICRQKRSRAATRRSRAVAGDASGGLKAASPRSLYALRNRASVLSTRPYSWKT